MTKAKLIVTGLATPAADDRLRLRGRLTLPSPFSPPLDPMTKGVRILLDDAMGGRPLDVAVPGGAYNYATKTGWKVNPSRTSWKYANGLGGIQGIVRVTVRASSAVPGQVDVGASGRNGAYPVAHGAIPVSATVVLDAPRATTGQCGRAAFPGPPPAPSCRFNATGSTLTCR